MTKCGRDVECATKNQVLYVVDEGGPRLSTNLTSHVI